VIDPSRFIAIANSALPMGSPVDSFGGLVDDPVFRSIIHNGAQIILTKDLIDDSARFGDAGLGSVDGIWDPNTGTMQLRVDEYLSLDDYLATLRHEGIHMAQSCKAFSLKSESIPIGLPITQEGIAQLEPYRYTNPSYYDDETEREAYSNDMLSSSEIASIIDKECGSKPWIKFFGTIRSTIQMFAYDRFMKDKA
jgi:hypothetical protein